MTKPFIVGNWKMNTTLEEAISLASAAQQATDAVGDRVEVGVCPPYPWLAMVRDTLQSRTLRIGAQDVSANENGAFTGDVSAKMLAPFADFAIIGHSERRTIHGETDEIIRDKVARALDARIGVVLCVGESKDERDRGEAESVVNRQLDIALGSLGRNDANNVTIAYEPVWAIGTGVAATANDATHMASTIRDTLEKHVGDAARSIRILYGGSANDQNAAGFLSAEGIDGLLVGGASLRPDVFKRMVVAAESAK